MPDYREIYRTRARQYDRLVVREDVQGNIWKALRRIRRFDGLDVVELGAGTGRETPQPPHAGLADYYAYLEQERGFCSTWIRTDYRFESVAEAAQLTRFFFGDELAARVEREGLICLPECTGIWWSHAS